MQSTHILGMFPVKDQQEHIHIESMASRLYELWLNMGLKKCVNQFLMNGQALHMTENAPDKKVNNQKRTAY